MGLLKGLQIYGGFRKRFEFVGFFNNRQIHQSLDYKTLEEVYKEGTFPNINKDIEVA